MTTSKAGLKTRTPYRFANNADRLIYRHSIWTRATHWVWAICLFFLLLSGLQIFNAHPALYIGDQSGFAFDNAILRMEAVSGDSGPSGQTEIFGAKFDTTGTFGLSGGEQLQARGFPAWATIPSGRDLASGRIVHFFFAWLFVFTLLVWLIASLLNRHLGRDVIPRMRDLRGLPRDIVDHVRFRLHHNGRYNSLQKLSYAGVLLVLFPLMILTGLAMSPGFNAVAPWIPEMFGGRQTARTVHFAVMVLLVVFFAVHILMVFAAGPINEMRSMLTGWYRTDPEANDKGDRNA